MVLADSSAWILAGADLASFGDPKPLVVTCPPVVQEVLQGSDRPHDYSKWREVLLGCPMLDAPVPFERYEEAARLYLRCRDAGFTIRKPADCLIAACALAHGAAVIHNDRDFDYIAKVTGLRVQRL
ncbi:MAG TPA: PIN domain-containing protein [Thermoanaerobaculia bacterium]|nr:PIN domain-containing protein [Thermoanaerobaculia bacterium]